MLTADDLTLHGCPVCGSRSFFTLPIGLQQDSILHKWEVSTGRQFPEEVYTRHCAADRNELSLKRCESCEVELFVPAAQGGPEFYAAITDGASEYYVTAGKWEFEYAITLLAQEGADRVLDYGSGAGVFLRMLLKKLPDATVYGYDLVPVASAEVEQHKRIDKLDLGAIDHRPVDAIVMMQVLEHLENPTEALREACSLLRPGGLVILAVPNIDGPTCLFPEAITNLPPHHLSRWREVTLVFLGRACGLQTLEIFTEPLPKYLWRSYLPRMIASRLPTRLYKIFIGWGLIDAALWLLHFLPITSLRFVRGHSAIAVLRKT